MSDNLFYPKIDKVYDFFNKIHHRQIIIHPIEYQPKQKVSYKFSEKIKNYCFNFAVDAFTPHQNRAYYTIKAFLLGLFGFLPLSITLDGLFSAEHKFTEQLYMKYSKQSKFFYLNYFKEAFSRYGPEVFKGGLLICLFYHLEYLLLFF